MKSTLSIGLLALTLALTGCVGSNSTETVEQENGETAFRVALLTPSSVNDAGWSALAYRGLLAIESELGAEVNNQEATGPQIRDAMRSYARQGYRLVFGHGFEYNEPAMEVARDFPDTVFVSSSGGLTAANVGAFRFLLEDGFYVAGYLAGRMTQTNVVGMIGGDDVPSIRSTFRAFRAGAEAANPNVTVREVFTGSGQDVARAKQATERLIAEGADFVIHQANRAAQGVFDACREKGILAFGANADQNKNESGVVLASAVIVAEPAFVDIARRVKEGTFEGSIVRYGMDSGAIGFVVNPDLADRIPADLREEIEDLQAQLRSGAVTAPRDEF